MTGLDLFNKLVELEPNLSMSYSSDKITLNIEINRYYLENILYKYINKTQWDKIDFKAKKQIEIKNKENVHFSHNMYNELKEKYKDEIKRLKNELKQEFINHLEINKDKIIKNLNNRIKQVERQKTKTNKNKQDKNNKMEEFSKVLTELGYQVSKIYNSNHHGISVSERKEADKYHKYINVESSNIKFATIEVKINQKEYKIGIKIETKGQIGCTFEELQNVYEKIKVEKELLEERLEYKLEN